MASGGVTKARKHETTKPRKHEKRFDAVSGHHEPVDEQTVSPAFARSPLCGACV
jgi:hypothetical protein